MPFSLKPQGLYKRPGEFETDRRAYYQAEADYRSRMNAFFEQLNQQQEQFEAAMGYKHKALAEDRRQFDVTADLKSRGLDIDEMFKRAQVELYGAQADALDQDWGDIFESAGAGLFTHLVGTGGSRLIDRLLGAVGLEDPNRALLEQIVKGKGKGKGQSGGADDSDTWENITEGLKWGEKILDKFDFSDIVTVDDASEWLSSFSADEWGAELFSGWESGDALADAMGVGYDSVMDDFSFFDEGFDLFDSDLFSDFL